MSKKPQMDTDQHRLVPKLRFPEFRDVGEWEKGILDNIAFLKNGYAFKSSNYIEDGEYNVITIANVQSGGMDFKNVKQINELPQDLQPHQCLEVGDILLSMTGNVGRVCLVSRSNCVLNQRVGKVVPKKITRSFLYHLIQNPSFQGAMQLKAQGGAQGNISSSDILRHAVCYPLDGHEQQKIADCLSSLDELITLQSQKVDALKAHKKGLMQQLFPSLTEEEAP